VNAGISINTRRQQGGRAHLPDQGNAMQQKVTFDSSGLKLSGLIDVPPGTSGRRPALIVLHGFGSNKDGSSSSASAELLKEWGYITLRIDFRGCGESEGTKGKVICLEQVEDTKAAVTYLQSRPDVDPDRIGVIGHSFGAAVAVYAAGTDKRIAACISCGGWGDGVKKFRKQHESPEAWKKFTDMMAEGRKRLAKGESMMVPRFDIVPIPPHLRATLSKGSYMEFPYEVVESMYNFKANEVVGNISPRPLLLVHPANDSVTPTEQSIELFQHAKQPTDLHLVANVDHFILSDDNPIVVDVLKDWLRKYLPA
jgi:hypothetical protein